MRDFQQFDFWQKAHQLTLKIYHATNSFPKDELYTLVSQMRRSASSIPTNIAEGCGRESNPESKRFLIIAAGSSSELQYQLILSKDLNYISNELFTDLNDDVTRVRKMIFSYSQKL